MGQSKPQQPELARKGHTPVDPDHLEEVAQEMDGPPGDDGRTGKIPEANRPGHRPEKDQDIPAALGGAGHGKGKRKKR